MASSPRIQELPDDFDESIDLNRATPKAAKPAPPSNKNVSLDEMFERRVEGSNAISDKSFEEIMYDMSKTPLFMNAEDVANQSMSTSCSYY